MRFVDTSFWVALQASRDARHREAAALWRAETRPLLTTNHVLGETWTFLRRAGGHRIALGFIDRVLALAALRVHHVDERLEQDAWAWLRRRDEREYSFVDAASFAVMRTLRVREALAFDGDFAAAGFIEVPPLGS
ncbi:MAG: type II toxin-antitoxin system VapC family toxin [Solirubrobacteraceae bacterium]